MTQEIIGISGMADRSLVDEISVKNNMPADLKGLLLTCFFTNETEWGK